MPLQPPSPVDLTAKMAAQGLLTTEEAAAYMGTTAHNLRRIWSNRHEIVPLRVGRTLMWREEDLRAYMASHPLLGSRRKSRSAA